MPVPASRSGRTALDVAVQAAKEAGNVLKSHFHHKLEIKRKGRGNTVTDVDFLSDKVLTEILTGEYPRFNLVSEESSGISHDAPYTWVIDPLDGTNNYSYGIPFFCLNVALLSGNEPVLGITYDPLRDELFQAEKGKGAFLNGSPIAVATRKDMETAFISFDLGYKEESGRQGVQVALNLWPGVHSLRVMGSGALSIAYVACGRVDLYFHRALYPWDVLSGALLVAEAGGKVTDWAGEPIDIHSHDVIAGSAAMYQQFVAKARSVR